MIRIDAWNGDPAPLVTALNAGFRDYAMPVDETPERIERQRRLGLIEPALTFVAWDGDRPVGAVSGTLRPDGRARVQAMAVAPEARSRGVGARLLGAVLDVADQHGAAAVHLECLKDNLRAQAFYERLGFRKARRLVCLRTAFTGGAPVDPSLVVGGVELLPAIEPFPPRPLHRDRVALAGMPDVRVAVDPEGYVVWNGPTLLDLWPPRARPARVLLTALPDGGAHILDVPTDDPLRRLLPRLRWVVFARQWEMVRARPVSAG